MARLQCPECGVDKKFGKQEKEDLLWYDEQDEERLTYDEARERLRVDDQETPPPFMTAKTTMCDCSGEVKFTWEGKRPEDYNWDYRTAEWPPNGEESSF